MFDQFDYYVIDQYIIDPILPDPANYQRLIKKLLYLTISKPDIAFVVRSPSEFMHEPKDSLMKDAIGVVRYLNMESSLGILMSYSSSNKLLLL